MSYNLRSKPKMRQNKSKRNREDSDDDFTNSPPRAKMSRVGRSPRYLQITYLIHNLDSNYSGSKVKMFFR